MALVLLVMAAVNSAGVKIELFRLDINKNGNRFFVAHGVGHGDECKGWHNYFVSLADAQGADAEMQACGAGTYANGMRGADVAGDRAFKLLQLWSQA